VRNTWPAAVSVSNSRPVITSHKRTACPRGRALEAYARQRRKFQEDRTGEKALKKLAEIKTGREVSFPKLADLPELWSQIPRRKAPNPTYADQCRLKLERSRRGS